MRRYRRASIKIQTKEPTDQINKPHAHRPNHHALRDFVFLSLTLYYIVNHPHIYFNEK
jgi:hypothetical protein